MIITRSQATISWRLGIRTRWWQNSCIYIYLTGMVHARRLTMALIVLLFLERKQVILTNKLVCSNISSHTHVFSTMTDVAGCHQVMREAMIFCTHEKKNDDRCLMSTFVETTEQVKVDEDYWFKRSWCRCVCVNETCFCGDKWQRKWHSLMKWCLRRQHLQGHGFFLF